MEHIQAESQKLKHGRSTDSALESDPVRYESRQYRGDLAVSVELKRNSRLRQNLQNDDLESRVPFLVALFRSAFVPDEPQANLVFTVENAKFFQELYWVRRAN